MAYEGLNIDDTVPNCNKYSHTIPAYPEVTSSTVFDDSFYLERRQECKRLIGGNVDYHTFSTECPTGIEDIQVGGKTEISIGETFFYTLEGEDNDTYVDNYHIVWSRPYGQMSIWGYESDTVDVITVQVAGYQLGDGVVTCTLTSRTDPSYVTVVTQPITIIPY